MTKKSLRAGSKTTGKTPSIQAAVDEDLPYWDALLKFVVRNIPRDYSEREEIIHSLNVILPEQHPALALCDAASRDISGARRKIEELARYCGLAH